MDDDVSLFKYCCTESSMGPDHLDNWHSNNTKAYELQFRLLVKPEPGDQVDGDSHLSL